MARACRIVLIAAAFAVQVLSCGPPGQATQGGASSPATAEAAPTPRADARAPRVLDWYPLRGGATWRYRVRKESLIRAGGEERRTSKPGVLTDECLGPSPGEANVWVLRRRVEEQNPRYERPVVLVVQLRLRVLPDSIRMLSIQQEGRARADTEVPHTVFSMKLEPDETVQRVGALEITSTPVLQDNDPVTVPFGQYPDAVRRTISGTAGGYFAGAPVDSGIVEESTWFARGIGPVRVERTMTIDVDAAEGMARIEEVMVRELDAFADGRT